MAKFERFLTRACDLRTHLRQGRVKFVEARFQIPQEVPFCPCRGCLALLRKRIRWPPYREEQTSRQNTCLDHLRNIDLPPHELTSIKTAPPFEIERHSAHRVASPESGPLRTGEAFILQLKERGGAEALRKVRV